MYRLAHTRNALRLAAAVSAVVSAAATGATVAACGGGGTGPGVAPAESLLAVGVARQDLSPEQPLEGFLAFFYDLETDRLLTAEASINGVRVATAIGIDEGEVYVQSADIQSGIAYRLAATVQTLGGAVAVTSQPVVVPAVFAIDLPATHSVGDPLVVSWSGVEGAERINVAVEGGGFTSDVPATQSSVTIPGEVFATLVAGETLEIEVTAFNAFYVPQAAGISSVADAETFAAELGTVDNVDGATGAFGAATTIGGVVAFE